jgi:hypothetical protein
VPLEYDEIAVDPSEQEQLLASLKFGRYGIQDGA